MEAVTFAAMVSPDSTKYFNIMENAIRMGPKTYEASRFFYAITGFDTVSSIFSKGKCKCWDVWQNDEQKDALTDVFIAMGNLPTQPKEGQFFYNTALFAKFKTNTCS